MKLLFYIIVYGFLGYLLERIINLIVYGFWLDNRVLYLPVQPMYGLGVVLTLIVYRYLMKRTLPSLIKWGTLLFIAVLFTALSEITSGLLYHYFYERLLWNYQTTFPMCYLPYVCLLPTSFFGILALFTVHYLHPYIEAFTFRLPRWLINGIVVLVFIDYILTYKEVLL